MAKSRVKIKGVKAIQTTFSNKVKSFSKKLDKIGLNEADHIVFEIRTNLRHDQINGPLGRKKLNHIFEGDLHQNTYAEIGAKFTSGLEHLTEIRLGYFVEHGLNLELGSGPTFVSLPRITEWALSRPPTTPDPESVQKKLATVGARAYPIIVPTFVAMAEDYRDDVFKEAAKEWA